MSGWFFDDNKKSNKEQTDKNTDRNSGNVYEAKLKYVGKVAGFLEKGVKEMRKDIKKL